MPKFISGISQLGDASKQLNAINFSMNGLNVDNISNYRAAVLGLSKEQATLLLSTKGLNQAQIDLILSNEQVTATQIAEAASLDGVNAKKSILTAENQKQLLASKLLTTEKLAEIASTIGLETAENGSLISKKALNAEMVKQQLESLGVVGSAQAQIMSMLGLTTAETGAATASNVLSGAMAKLNIVLATNPIGALITAIGIAIGSVFLLKKGFDAVTDSAEDISERTEELITKYNEMKNTADNNAKTVESLADEYETLSKGVNGLGENVSLTSDEYDRYNEIVNQIAEMFPELVAGYTDEGNAILSLKGNVEGLRDAYKEAQQEAYNLLVATGKDDNGNDIMEDYKNLSELDWYDSDAVIGAKHVTTTVKRDIAKQILDLMSNMDTAVEKYDKLAQEIFDTYGDRGYNYLEEMGLPAITDIFSDTTGITKEALVAGRATVQSYYQGFQSEIDGKLGNVRLLANAFLNVNDFYKDDYVSSEIKNTLSLIVNSIDEETANSFNGDPQMVGAFVNSVVNGIKESDRKIKDAITDLFTNQELSPEQKNNLIKQIQDYFGKDNPISVFLQPQFEENETTQKNIESALSKFGEGSKGDLKAFFEKNSINTQEEVDKWNEITKGTNTATEAMEKYVQSSTSLDKMTVSLSDLEKASDKIKTLGSAFKELSDDGYITTKTLGEIKTAVGMDDETFEQYKNTLLNAKVGSSKFNDVMSDLTYKILDSTFKKNDLVDATEEEIAAVLRENSVINAEAVARSYLINTMSTEEKKRTQAIISKYDLTEMTKESVEAFLSEAEGENISRLEMIKLTAATVAFNNTELSVSDKINQLKDLALYAGVATEAELAAINPNVLGRRIGNQGGSVVDYVYNKLFGSLDSPEYSIKDPSSSAPDKPNVEKLDYSDYYDEILSDKQKARKHYEEENDKLQRELEQAIEDKNLEEVDRVAELIKDNNAEAVKQLNSQLSTSQKTLDDEILPLIYGIAPELQIEGGWDAVSDVQKEAIREKYKKAILDENNRWEQQSYNILSKNGNKQTEAYKQAEAEHKKTIEGLEYESDMFDQLVDSADSYVEDMKEIPDLMDEWNDKTKETVEKQINSIDDVFSEYKRHIDRQIDELQKQADAYDILINKAQARADAEKSMYDSLRNVRQLQRDISKELETNKALGEYLDEDIRKLLFNDDDYVKLSEKLEGISSDITGLGLWYQNQINSLIDDNWYLESAITAEYERRLAMKEKEYEIVRAELDLEKKKQELNNILNEKNIRMLTKNEDGKYEWTYVHNVEEASRVAGEIAELEGEISETRLQAQEDAIVNQKQAEADALNAEKASIEKRIEIINEETDALALAIENITNPLVDFGDLVTQLNAKLNVAFKAGVGGGTAIVKSTGSISSSTENSRHSNSSRGSVSYVAGVDYSDAIGIAEANGDYDYAASLERQRNAKIDSEGLNEQKTYKYNSFDNGGSAFGKGFIFKDTNLEEVVLDPVQTDYFKHFVEHIDKYDIVANQMSDMIKRLTPSTSFLTANNRNDTYSFNGDIILPNVREPRDFMVELKNSLQQNSFRNT